MLIKNIYKNFLKKDMIYIMIYKKSFLNFDEQIELLKSKNLSFLSKDDENKFKWYLQKFNYQNFVNGYNDLLMVNFNRKNDRYFDYANSSHLIAIYNFDRSLHSHFFSDLLNIEIAFATSVCYYIMYNFNEIDCVKYGLLMKLTKEELLHIFPGVKKIYLYNSNNKNASIDTDKNISELHKIILGHSKKHKIINKYQNESEIPLWVLSINWTFGNINKIFSLLNNTTKKSISDQFLKNKQSIFKNYYICFEKTMLMLNDFRNSVCHGNVVYNFAYSRNFDNIQLLYKNLINNSHFNQSIKLNEVANIINYLSPNKTKIIEFIEKSLYSLENKIHKETFDKLKKDLNF